FSYLRSPLPPTSTLFPYTTLFRSKQSQVPVRVVGVPQPLPEKVEAAVDPITRHGGIDNRVRDFLRRFRRQHLVSIENENPVVFEDRKSTRLNSSHQIISYAVFCLK